MPLTFLDSLILPFIAIFVVLLYVYLFRWRKKRGRDFSKNRQFLKKQERNLFAYGLYTACLSLALVFLYLAWFMPSFYREKMVLKSTKESTSSGLENYDEVVFVIDVSSSMEVPDATEGKTRLIRAKEIVKSVTEALSGIYVSLVAFQSDAILQVPKTLDYFYFWISLDNLQSEETKDGGTNLINMKEFIENEYGKNNQKIRQSVVVLTDGEDTALMNKNLELTQSAKDKIVDSFGKVKVKEMTWQFVGIGSEKGGIVPDVTYDKKKVTSSLRKDLLLSIAHATNGIYLEDNSLSLFDMTNGILSNFAPKLTLQGQPLIGYSTTKEVAQKILPEEVVDFTAELFLIALILLFLPLFIQQRKMHET